MEEIDIEKLRKDLINEFGTASSFSPNAMMDVINIENASADELLNKINETNLDINDYIIDDYERRI